MKHRDSRAAMTGPEWTEPPSSWIVTDGSTGMENQCLGLAEALGLPATVKRLSIRQPWRRLPPLLWVRPLSAIAPAGDQLAPPWPDLLISCGKRSVAPAVAIRRASAGRTFAVHIQDPQVPPHRFDLVIAPEHDRLRGDNVILSKAAIHRVTAEGLSAAAEQVGNRFDHLPRPRVAVLIGGSNGRLRLTPAVTERLSRRLLALTRDHGAGLMVTPSRRTGAENEAVLRRELSEAPALVWDGTGENPYFAFLALADAIVVTGDSVSMVSEACSTGKPVYVADLEGRSRRIEAFLATLRSAGMARTFDGRLETWTYPAPNDTAAAASAVRQRLKVHLAV